MPKDESRPVLLLPTDTHDSVAAVMRVIAIWALALFEALWLNVIVPGHTRGVVVLPGTRQAVAVCPYCVIRHSPDQKSGPRGSNEPTSSDRANCAICFFAAHLAAATVIDCRPRPLELLAILPPPAAVSLRTRSAPAAQCRGPPTQCI